ncbi:MAG: hypothetical protein ABI572_08515 [Actinomycetota bacterium]
MAAFSEPMGDTYATDDVLPRMAQILADPTGESAATVLLRIGSELQPLGRHGDKGPRPSGGPARRRRVPDLPGDLAAEVRRQESFSERSRS